jgi:hypothetical protein
MTEPHLSERQRKWFESVRAGLERDTGRSLADWVAIARACPETGHRARLKWFKETHGLLQNRAAYVLSEAFEPTMSWDEPARLVDALWTDPAARRIFEAVDAKAMAIGAVIRTPRKGYTAWARNFQFAAMKPAKGGAILGLAVATEADGRLEPRAASPSWSERLPSQLRLASPADVDAALVDLLRLAWDRS